MAHYKDQEDMFLKRAEKCRKDGDRYWAMALKAESEGSCPVLRYAIPVSASHTREFSVLTK